MDWGKTLSSEQPKAADLAFLPPASRPTQVQAAKQRQRSPGARFRPGQQRTDKHHCGGQAPLGRQLESSGGGGL
uniref:Uncharacterized protein n=1 Tax=Macaca mulatta TaxID=9544 RepID=A0A5F7Z713_MACMU